MHPLMLPTMATLIETACMRFKSIWVFEDAEIEISLKVIALVGAKTIKNFLANLSKGGSVTGYQSA
ncbi:hypothetical protein ACTXT7_004897 [Hymenolepis weldensis]